MSYYLAGRGDYYRMGRGDYYRGDPGLFSGIGKFLGGVVKTVGGVVSTAARVAGVLTNPVGAGLSLAHQLTAQGGGMGPMLNSQTMRPIALGPLVNPGQAGAAAQYGLINMQLQSQTGKVRNVKMNPVTGQIVRRHRRMRVTNPKALRRALRRAYGFEKLAMRTIHLLHPKKHVRFGGFKKRRRAA